MEHRWHFARPPLWLAAAALASGWGAVYTILRWTVFYIAFPLHMDVRIWYVAAEAGLRYGWATIYDLDTLRSLSSSFPAGEHYINASAAYPYPPLLAWLFVPLTAVSEPVAYLLWTLISLGALVWAWYIAAPYQGLPKLTLLLLAIAMWPVLLSFYFGQAIIVMLALVATAWWFCAQERPLAAGIALALATALKPQLVILIPLALLASGRYQAVIGWMVGCALLGVASIVALGPSGLMGWWQSLKYVQADPAHTASTLVYMFGLGPLTYALWAVEGAAALVIARWRRSELEIVFAAGILGSVAVSFHLHQADYSMLILAGWLVLRTAPSLWHCVWLLVGILTMQAMTLAPPPPQLIWDAGWLGILMFSTSSRRGAPAPATQRAAG